jgi:hypothetical protein
MDNQEKILACLERIAFNTQGGPLEFDEFKEGVLYANTRSEVPLQEGNKDKVSHSKRRGRRSKKHEDGGDTHEAGVRAGQEEEEKDVLD